MSELHDMPARSTASPRRAPDRGRVAPPVERNAPTGRPERSQGRRKPHRSPVELRPLRLAALVLLLVAAALYVPPLRAFFAAQDSYFSQVAALSASQVASRALHTQIADLHNAAYIERQARAEFQLVPAGLQAFVVKGLPRSTPSASPTGAASAQPHLSLSARLGDLWHTLLE